MTIKSDIKAFAAVELDGAVHAVHKVSGYVEVDRALIETRDSPSIVDESVFKAAMRMLAAGVVMVTTRVDGRPWGLTISACTSVSTEPPQLLVSVGAATVSCQQILKTGCFGVSILAANGRSLAEFGSVVGAAKFVDEFCEPAGPPREAPMISGALFHLDCRVARSLQVADHILIIGEVRSGVAAPSTGKGRPLIYFDRRFHDLGPALDA